MNSEIKNFYDLDVWKKAHALSIRIYQVTKNFPKEELFGITSQLRRATASITANVAEGFARFHFNDKIRFYYQARGSAAETQNFLMLAKDLNLINQDICENLFTGMGEVIKLINGLIRSIENQK